MHYARPEAHLVLTEEKVIDEAVRHIAEVITDTIHRAALEVGNYLLDNFFRGDVDYVVSQSPTKCTSFRMLAARCGTQELPISKSWLHNSVKIAIMRRALPETAAFALLPTSHQTILLPLRHPNAIEAAAGRALAARLSARELRKTIREQRQTPSGVTSHAARETSPVPRMARSLTRLLHRQRSHFTLARIDELSEKSAEDVLAALREAQATINELTEKLELREKREATPPTRPANVSKKESI